VGSLPMLEPSEKAEAERRALAKCAAFEQVLTEIVYAGLENMNPFFAAMTRAAILEYVRHHFGELFVGFCERMPELILH
jgi:hypothetical protein